MTVRSTTLRPGLVTMLLIVAACVVPEHGTAATNVRAPVVRSIVAPPTSPCDEDHILDIEIINGVLFECACDHMMFGPPVCEWQEITSQADDPQRFRRFVSWARAKHMHIVTRYVRVKTVIV